MDNEFILYDRLEVIKNTILENGIDNFYLLFSGGKDSVVVHKLLDMALPNNNIPRVYIDTGVDEYELANNTNNYEEIFYLSERGCDE